MLTYADSSASPRDCVLPFKTQGHTQQLQHPLALTELANTCERRGSSFSAIGLELVGVVVEGGGGVTEVGATLGNADVSVGSVTAGRLLPL
jgi:hypothetical protein